MTIDRPSRRLLAALLCISAGTLSGCLHFRNTDGTVPEPARPSDGTARETAAYSDGGIPVPDKTALPDETSAPLETAELNDPYLGVDISFIAAGDNLIHPNIYMDAKSRGNADKEYDLLPVYSDVAEQIAAADYAFINQETVMAGASYGYSGYPCFNSPQQLGLDLVTVGFDIVNIANNHMLDMDNSTRTGYKSTLLNCIATVIAPTGGAVALHGKCITTLHGKALADYRGKEIGYLFQNFELIDNLTGRENILLPLALHGVSEAESRERLTKLADYLEVADVLDKFPAQMSGGQKQRIAAARALILDPEIVLADEPTGALDSKNARSLMEKLSGLNADAGTTILMVTHDCNAASYCKRILFIQDGVLFHELRRDVPDETQQAFYGRILAVMAQLGGGSANVL